MTSGPNKGAYFHPQFVQDHPEWCKHLTRQRAKKASRDGTSAPSSPAGGAGKTVAAKAIKSSSSSRTTEQRPIAVKGVPSQGAGASASLMPRQVSESSLESFSDLLRELDTASVAGNVDATLDLAEFEGFTFHLLEQERYEELNLEFKFQENSGSNNMHKPQQPQDSSSLLPPFAEEEASTVHTLLQELEQGTFGTPKTSFDRAGGIGESRWPVQAAT